MRKFKVLTYSSLRIQVIWCQLKKFRQNTLDRQIIWVMMFPERTQDVLVSQKLSPKRHGPTATCLVARTSCHPNDVTPSLRFN